MLLHSNPERAKELEKRAKADLAQKWTMYEFLATREAPVGPNGQGELQPQQTKQKEQIA